MTTSTMSGNNSRIPAALQNVFLQSLRGEDVEKIEPPSRMGFRVFQRNTYGDRFASVNNNNSSTISTGRSSLKQTSSSSSQYQSAAAVKAPNMNSLYSERNRMKDTAATASRKAMLRRAQSAPAVSIDTMDPNSPHVFLMRAMERRGYSTKQYNSLEGGYYCRPTPLQQASYGARMSKTINASDGVALTSMMQAGLSPNPCNSFGESLLHMVCRRGDTKLLRILVEAGCSLQVTDDYGRTPLHDACWRAEPAFDSVRLILDSDPHLVQLLDCRGTPPLAYVKPENYDIWNAFLEKKLDRFWPERDVSKEGMDRPPPLALRPPHSLPIPDPEHALPIEVASMVANGQMDPQEAMALVEDDDDDDDDSDSDDSMSDGDSDYYSDEEDDIDASEMREICFRAGGPVAIARQCFGKDINVILGGNFVANNGGNGKRA